jgi:hypothetical protein
MTELKKYFLDLKMNDHEVSLKLDSGCDQPLINTALWSEMGEPNLVSNGETRRSATGAIPLKGGFLAQMNFSGIEFQCHVLVSDDDSTRNLIGRRALPFLLDLDWDTFFTDGSVTMVSDSTPDNINKEELMDDALRLKSLPFHVNVLVNDKHFLMNLDTGATCSIAGLAKWKELGEPHITSVKRSVKSTSDQPIPILGECSLKINYNGTDAQLPLLIADSNIIPAILGTNWFDLLKLNFNSIFRGIKFIKPLNQPVVRNAVPKWTKIVYDCKNDVGGSRPAKHITTRSKPEHVKVRKYPAESPPPDSEAKRVKIVYDLERSDARPSTRRSKLTNCLPQLDAAKTRDLRTKVNVRLERVRANN